MKVEVSPTENPEQLAENLENRVESVEIDGESLEVETDSYSFLERVPGVESFRAEGEEHLGLGGSPVDEQAYARIESKNDAVKCLLATVEGFSLVILNTGREWDLRNLKKFNPDIKHVKQDDPVDELGIERSLFESEKTEKIDVNIPEEEEVLKIYRELLT